MRLAGVPESAAEWLLGKLGLLPAPLLDTQVAYSLARTVMLGVKVGAFEALASGPLAGDEVAQRCDTHPRATRKLLDALVGAGYLRQRGNRYALASVSRKWLLASSRHSLCDKLLMQFREWDFVAQYDEFLRTGTPLDIHARFSDVDWQVYQRGMRSMAGISAPEVAWRTPVPKGARDLLDIGGSHGYYSVALCRRHPSLQAVVLDLPKAVTHAREILAREGLGARVTLRAGDALKDDLGSEAWDAVFVAQLVHHFDEETNRSLARRVARALRPGGVLVIQELVRPESPQRAGQVGALLDLYFAATSASGTWSTRELASWQREAGLVPRRPAWLWSLPGSAQQVAVKPAI